MTNDTIPEQTWLVLINVTIVAASTDAAIEIAENGDWLSYQDDEGAQHGKIVYLFPEQRRTRVIRRSLIGTPIPLLRADGERYFQYGLRTYGAAMILILRADSESDAANYAINRAWFSPGRSVELNSVSAPMTIVGSEESQLGELQI